MERIVCACKFCQRETSKSNLIRHEIACKKNPDRHITRKNKSDKWIAAMHDRKGNGTNQYTLAKKLGLPKPVISNETRDKLREGPKKQVWTDERRKIASDSAIRRGLGGRFVNNRCEYNGHKFGSSYEVSVARSLDKNLIDWIKPRSFSYVDPKGKARRYTPDFYLPDFNVYLDPKNDFLINNINPSMGFSDKEKISIVERSHNVRVIVLDKENLTWDKISMRL